MQLVTRLAFCALSLVTAACSRDHVGVGADLAGTGTVDFFDGEHHDGGGDGPTVVTNTALLGVWQVSGTDPRGAYSGQLELRANAAGTSMIRVVKYSDVTVENDRELWWAWTGAATAAGSGLTTATSLVRADFILARDALTRTDADKIPLAVTGTIAAPSNGTTTAHFAADGLALDDTLTNRTDSGAQPIFAIDRTSRPVNDAPSAAAKTSLFALYSRRWTGPPPIARRACTAIRTSRWASTCTCGAAVPSSKSATRRSSSAPASIICMPTGSVVTSASSPPPSSRQRIS